MFCMYCACEEWADCEDVVAAQVEVTVTGDGTPHVTLKRALQQQQPAIQARLQQYVDELNAL